MTVGEFGELGDLVPEFQELVERYTAPFEFDAGSRRLLDELVRHGSQEILALPEGPERREAIQAATAELERALQAGTQELRTAGRYYVDEPTMLGIMEALCPVPPFCLGGGGAAGMSGQTGLGAGEVAETDTTREVAEPAVAR